MNADDIEDELRDVVFDHDGYLEGSKALVLAADGFLTGTDERPPQAGFDTNSQQSNDDGKWGKSQMSENSKMQDKIRQNKVEAARHDPRRIKLLQDRLNEKGKARLEQLLKDIDDNMEELMREKAEYHKQGMKSTTSLTSQSQGGFGGVGQFDTRS